MRSLFAVFIALAAAAASHAQVWQIDPAHSSAQFTVRHMMISNVRGEFGKMTGSVQYDPADPSKTTVEATIDAASVSTRNEQRDKHLRSADFFDVEKYPALTFKSKRVDSASPGKIRLIGDLTLRGTTREVALDVDGPSAMVKDQRGNRHLGAAASTKINRKEFGMAFNRALEGGGVVVGDEVAILIDVELIERTAVK